MFKPEIYEKANAIKTSDDMYEVCRVYCERMKKLTGIARLLVMLEYQAVHYLYRLNVKNGQPYDHGKYYKMADEACQEAYHRMVLTINQLRVYDVKDTVFDEE